MTLSDVAYLLLIACFVALFWQHLDIGHRAYRAARNYTGALGLTLLDQSIVLRKFAVRKSNNSLFALERHYHFEFCSVGDQRYPGKITFIGKRQSSIELAPYKTSEQTTPIE
ncbi:Protein of unknown function [Alteromonadaceae bacterium Bs31]|nr:Protein of unknown function [Alteromonadaceae bacterium Bs31]